MLVFHSDLDNTLIYSCKHDIGTDKICVEVYQGREISYMTEKSRHLLKKIYDRVVFVPTTTRTIEQYSRIDLGIGTPEYALVCNGGVLLVHGAEDMAWYEESRRLVADCRSELETAEKILKTDTNVNFEIRNIRELFLFTRSKNPGSTVKVLQQHLDLSLVDVFCNGVKVYVVPKKLSKGTAVNRFRRLTQASQVISAGDSEFDISMLEEADLGFAPQELVDKYRISEKIIAIGPKKLFSDELLLQLDRTF